MQDCTYTIMALLPTLGTRILEELDVECISLELQSRSAKRQRPTVLPRLPTPVLFTPLDGENLLASGPNVISDNTPQSHEQATQGVDSPIPVNTAVSINGEVDPMAQTATSWASASEALSSPMMVNAQSMEADSNQLSTSSGPVILDPLSDSKTSAFVSPPHPALYFHH